MTKKWYCRSYSPRFYSNKKSKTKYNFCYLVFFLSEAIKRLNCKWNILGKNGSKTLMGQKVLFLFFLFWNSFGTLLETILGFF